jgi:hypothetical protein
MSWTCPNCGKEFRNNNQWHSCTINGFDTHLKNKPDENEIKNIFSKLTDVISGFGNYELTPNKSSIQFWNGATFCGCRLKSKEVIIEFFLDSSSEHNLIYKELRVSGIRSIFYASITSAEQIDSELIDLLKVSYLLVSP